MREIATEDDLNELQELIVKRFTAGVENSYSLINIFSRGRLIWQKQNFKRKQVKNGMKKIVLIGHI